MNSTIVHQGQSFLDKVIETTGSIENTFEMAFLNNQSITDAMQIGQELKVSTITKKEVVALFTKYNMPATAIDTANSPIETYGIGTMTIGTTFIVS